MPAPFHLQSLAGALALALLAAAPAPADPAASDAGKTDPRVVIARRLEVEPGAVRLSPLPGVYEVAKGADVLYVSADGRYALSGDLYETQGGHNLTEQRRVEARAAALKDVRESDAIVFSPEKPRFSVFVFTDVDCAFCRALHKNIAEYNRLGVRVRYLPFPRGGPGTESWQKAEAVWCATDRREALTKAKLGIAIPGKANCATPVERSYELGQELGIRGTPGIYTERGEYVAGFLSPEELVRKLRELEKQPAG